MNSLYTRHRKTLSNLIVLQQLCFVIYDVKLANKISTFEHFIKIWNPIFVIFRISSDLKYRMAHELAQSESILVKTGYADYGETVTLRDCVAGSLILKIVTIDLRIYETVLIITPSQQYSPVCTPPFTIGIWFWNCI